MESEKEPLSFGRYLQAIRLEKKISLEQVSAQTRIGVGNLLLIEQEDHERLPAKVYVKGFLRSYAAAIGADGDEHPGGGGGAAHHGDGALPGGVRRGHVCRAGVERRAGRWHRHPSDVLGDGVRLSGGGVVGQQGFVKTGADVGLVAAPRIGAPRIGTEAQLHAYRSQRGQRAPAALGLATAPHYVRLFASFARGAIIVLWTVDPRAT